MGLDQIRKELAEKKAKESIDLDETHPDNQPEETDFYRVEGVRNSISKLEIYLPNGGILAFEYTMMPVVFAPSNDKIVIPTMLNVLVTITGNNLERLRKRLVDNRVKWIRPHLGTKPPMDDDKLFVEAIKIEAAEFNEAVEKLIS